MMQSSGQETADTVETDDEDDESRDTIGFHSISATRKLIRNFHD